MAQKQELMLILNADRDLDDAHERYRVTQKVSPRVLIVELIGNATKEELKAMSGVDAVLVSGEKPASEIIASLTETEALFLEAFTKRSQPKARPGEGLDWDAGGFLPPDPPTSKR